MGDVYRESTRSYREDDHGSDDDRYRSTTIRRYKVAPSRTTERVPDVGDYPIRAPSYDRPRSTFEPYEERRTERAIFYDRDDGASTSKPDDRNKITVYETKNGDFDYEKKHKHRHGRHHSHDDEIKVERRSDDFYEDSHGHDVERYRKETEYYAPRSPPPPPVIIRQRQEPQKIYVQEAAPPAPIIVPRQEPGVIVLREREHCEHEPQRQITRREPRNDNESYYYRREVREGDGWGRERERDYALARFDRHRRHRDEYHSDDDEYVVHRKIVRRDSSGSPHHKRELAAGALAGAGITALMASRRDSNGGMSNHRGRKVAAGGALGLLGTEALRRARSAYGERYHDSRDSSPDDHSRLKKGLGIAAVALAAAGAAKYYQANKIEKEEASRGRSRGRRRSHSSSGSEAAWSQSRSRSRGRTKSRRRSLSTIAKAALGTAATAGIVKHYRSKSKARSGSRSKSRSKSRLRHAAEIGGAAAAAGVASKLWSNHKNKKEGRGRSKDRELSDDDRYSSRRGSPSRDRSRSRSRSIARSHRGDSAADTDLGLIEYGDGPLGPDGTRRREQGYESEAEERRRRRQRRRARDTSTDGEGSPDGRKRSKSRLRDMAAAGAAAFGIKEYKERKDQEKRQQRSEERREGRSRDRSRERDQSRDRGGSRHSSRDAPPRSKSKKRGAADDYFNPDHGRISPPMASGGAYYPPYPSTPGAGQPPYPGEPSYGSYHPQDYTGYPMPNQPPPPGGNMPNPAYNAPPPGPPPGPPNGGNIPPDHVSEDTQRGRAQDAVKRDGIRSKSVSFTLSPKSSRTLELHRKEQSENEKHDHANDGDKDAVGTDDVPPPSTLQRSATEPVRKSGASRRRHSSDSDLSDSDVEYLPDRFDNRGRAVDSSDRGRDEWTSRSGQFERRAQKPGDASIRGAWQVGGTDSDAVQNIAKGVTEALDGKGGWLGLLGTVLNSGLLEDGKSAKKR